MRYEKIILHPVVTEKAVQKEEQGIYVFKVTRSANKTEIAKAIEKIFATKVIKVRIVNTSAEKKKRWGREIGTIYGFKKAIVTLEKGKTIKLREEKKEEKKKGKEEHAHDDSHQHVKEGKTAKFSGATRGIQKEKGTRKTISS